MLAGCHGDIRAGVSGVYCDAVREWDRIVRLAQNSTVNTRYRIYTVMYEKKLWRIELTCDLEMSSVTL